ncbi:GNAT family N-acetyltransferase [Streptomyces sp. NBC_00557]|uniref:GNAT family N-acetyltransferase n=1 Tax=Streptomyces sp. NBC_00557 TaxID=2975776 RepID=UPI002E805075|nr:GNAT family N-acetyltransferase [Streptomyces sp. NBC_00557]WUC40308.1 GNAT family N-acetyltransferase [Streptomyces sp. NBC_00557]
MTHAVRMYTGSQAMDFLGGPWRELYAQDAAATPFQSPIWLTAWAQHLAPAMTPVVLVSTSPTGRPLAALALARQDDGADTRIVPLSAPYAECIRPVGPHADDPAVAASFVFHLMLLTEEGGEGISMSDVPATSGLGRSLTQISQSVGWNRVNARSARVRLPFVYAALSRSTRREHQRRQRAWDRAAAHHRVTYARTHHPQTLLDAHAVIAALRPSRWYDPLFSGPAPVGGLEHWGSVLRRLDATKTFIATLAVDDTVVAARLCLTRGRHCYSLVPVTDAGYRHLAPDHALLRYLIGDLTRKGFTMLHLGRTPAPEQRGAGQYQPEWTSTLSVLNTPHLVPT